MGHGETPEQEQVRVPGQQVQRRRRGRGQHGRDERGRPQQPQRTRDQVRGAGDVWELGRYFYYMYLRIFSLLTAGMLLQGGGPRVAGERAGGARAEHQSTSRHHCHGHPRPLPPAPALGRHR